MFWYSETWKISTYPKQEGSKRPLGYDYPAHRASFVGLLCLVAFHIRRGRSLLILIGKVLQDLRVENKQKEVPRFFYLYTNGAFGANFPQN